MAAPMQICAHLHCLKAANFIIEAVCFEAKELIVFATMCMWGRTEIVLIRMEIVQN